MRISGFTTTRPQGSSTRLAEDFMKFLGDKPQRMGIVANLYPQYTASHMTEALMNVWDPGDKRKGFKSIDSYTVEWDIKVNRIHKVRITEASGTGINKSDIMFYMPENYYNKFDVFVVEETRQQFRVVNRPQRVADNSWLVIAQIHDGSYESAVTPADLAGKLTRFVTNYMPELHEEGYVRYQSNLEKHRASIATHRADVDMSAQYRAMEDIFINIAKGDKEVTYQMNSAEKDCLDSFMEARNNALLWGKSNLDKNFKPTAFDPETGRPVVSSDGIVAQIERFATKFVFEQLNVEYFKKVIMALVAKCENPSGNTFVMICNTPFMMEIQRVLDTTLKDYKIDAPFLYNKVGDKVRLGAQYDGYSYMGNTLIFKLDRSFDIEYPDRKFGVMVDLTADGTTGRAALEMLTFRGTELVHNWIVGVGGKDGRSSGEVSSRVSATKIVNWGTAGVILYNPYRSVIMIGGKTR